ncbi:MAG: AGE family epimerase/isomerase [Brevundimonas sp.]|uniref:mannose-1-phosphate guanylyltransferase n=1 Tax=Brevundimonas sp. TaxID=1871086 RepID=UPI0025C18518|nr:sugar phosphate nucleotidyltransferase [Brevundimonas sp.]MCH4269913.1 AGE family epimerase/isomerase [Brevundimonas sp.]
MRLFPVIMCGGSGTRLWPASRLSRPKQFMPLAGNRSPFQETVTRVAPLVAENGRIVVIGGALHRRTILEQLLEIDVDAAVLLEPESRDSAAAMAAAAHWTLMQEPAAVNVFLASDHHVPDHAAFRAAVLKAVKAAEAGRIVTLGVRPTEPSEAYGYIKPLTAGLSPVEAFIEKPSRDLAERYIDQGFLWNSGNFIARAEVLAAELKRFAPGVEAAARTALQSVVEGADILLGAAFRDAPRISIDYAVMERTDLASVLAVDFKWSDLGAWDAIAASGEGEIGGHIFEDAEGCMARAPDGMIVAALGVRNLAIVAERDAVLVCDLSRTQEVKKIVERIRLSSPRHMDFHHPPEEDLRYGFSRLRGWLRLRALPLWATVGRTEDGAFCELISLEGRRIPALLNPQVQARQAAAFALAGRLGWEGPWRALVTGSLDRLEGGAAALSAWAVAAKAGLEPLIMQERAAALREDVIREATLSDRVRGRLDVLKACLDWSEATTDPAWREAVRLLAASVEAALDCGRGAGASSPGMMLEAAGLLARSGGDTARSTLIRDLYSRGVSEKDALGLVILDGAVEGGPGRPPRARFEAQIARLKAATALAEADEPRSRKFFADEAAAALRAVWLYLTPEGLWRDNRLEGGEFIDDSANALALYNLLGAFEHLAGSGILNSEVEMRAMLR